MADRVLQRRDTAANWAAANPILMEGEIGIVTDGAKGYKIGDGATRWNALEYPANPTSVVQEIGNDQNAVMSQKATCDIVGLSDYPKFVTTSSYTIGDIVNYNGLIYKFTSIHPKGAWNIDDVEQISSIEDISGKFNTLNNSSLEPSGFEYNKISGYVVYDTGLSYNVDFEASDFIPVTPGQRIYYTLRVGGNEDLEGSGIVGYDADKNFVMYLFRKPAHATGARESYYNRSLIIPASVRYIRGCSCVAEGVPLLIGDKLTTPNKYDTNVVLGGKDWEKHLVNGSNFLGNSELLKGANYYNRIAGNIPSRVITIDPFYVDQIFSAEFDSTKLYVGYYILDTEGNEIYFNRENFYTGPKTIHLNQPYALGLQIRKKDDSAFTEEEIISNLIKVNYKKISKSLFKFSAPTVHQGESIIIPSDMFMKYSRTPRLSLNVLSNMYYTGRSEYNIRLITSYRIKCDCDSVRITLPENYDMFIVTDNDFRTELDTGFVGSNVYVIEGVKGKYIGIGIKKPDNTEFTQSDIDNLNLKVQGIVVPSVVDSGLYQRYEGEKIQLENLCKSMLYLNMDNINFSAASGSQQSLAIYDNYGFLFYDGGKCTIIDMNSRRLVASINTAVVASNNHQNNANFGNEFAASNPSFPLIYISQFKANGDCYVQSITLNSASLVQTIKLNLTNNPIYGISWAVDSVNNFIWAIGYKLQDWSIAQGNAIYYAKFALPKLSDGQTVTLTDSDVLKRFEMPYNVHQGFYCIDDKIYAPCGLGGAGTKLLVMDTTKQEYVSYLPLNTREEPEGICQYEDSLMISFNTGNHGKLYKFTFQ